jgi:4-alpha-glucanotransferase
MHFERSAGTLVHPTSFPTPYGIGDLGPAAREFIHFLVDTDQSIWQVLPLTPVGYGNSPYASYSAFAGNHYLISPDILVEKGLLTREECQQAYLPGGTVVPFEEAYERKSRLFAIAFNRFKDKKDAATEKEYKKFQKDNDYWLDNYALFMACFEANNRNPWNLWDKGLAKREKSALTKFKKDHADRVEFHRWAQFEFARQWHALKEFANLNGILIVGDIPIFVDHNSADVWANPEYFHVDENGNRTLVAGVPPDYFSETGQLWGNPLYRWKNLEKDGFSWWIERFRFLLRSVDAIRLDHFRGFDAYWEVPASEPTAINGRWVKGPGQKLFTAIKAALGDLPIIAEDLGVLTPSVISLRDDNHFPGMKILQFAWNDNAANSFLPHNFKTSHCIVYTGTHDNDTSVGWYSQGTELEKHRIREYCQSNGNRINWDLIRLGMLSTAVWCIIPMQDFMNLGTEHRMNLPGTVGNNWQWRYTRDLLNGIDRKYVKHLVSISARNPRLKIPDANLTHIDAAEA